PRQGVYLVGTGVVDLGEGPCHHHRWNRGGGNGAGGRIGHRKHLLLVLETYGPGFARPPNRVMTTLEIPDLPGHPPGVRFRSGRKAWCRRSWRPLRLRRPPTFVEGYLCRCSLPTPSPLRCAGKTCRVDEKITRWVLVPGPERAS